MTGEAFDAVVIGGGPAGAAAAIAGARAGARVALLEPLSVGGEAMNLPEIAELPEAASASGPDVVTALTERVMAAGVDLRLGETATALEPGGGGWRVETDAGAVATAVVVLATGAAPVGLPEAPGAGEEPHGAGVFTCASCDAPLFAGRRVAVAGGGDTGAGAAILLSEHASSVVLYEREDELTCEAVLRRHLAELPNVEVRLRNEVRGLAGGAPSEGIRVVGPGGEALEQAEGLMLAVGLRPRSELAAAHAELDPSGAVRVGPGLASSAPGLFAAGDVRERAAWRFAAAWGDGLTAARSLLSGAVGAAR